MKNVCIVTTVCLLLTAAAFAQSDSQWLMKVHIPFSFAVADQSMPPGVYNIYTVTPQRLIRITNTDGKHTAMVNTALNYAKSSSPDTHLVFEQHGSDHFLTQIWFAGDNLSRNLAPSKKAMELARGGGVPQTATVIALGNR
jgi:hypothetical protein